MEVQKLEVVIAYTHTHAHIHMHTQGVASVTNAASKLLSFPSTKEVQRQVSHTYRPLMLRACEEINFMDSQVCVCVCVCVCV
jgi:hypothetical protein